MTFSSHAYPTQPNPPTPPTPPAPLPPSTPVLVVGAGAMGRGIAQVAARAGHRVYLHDAAPEAAARGRAAVARELEQGVARGRLSAADADATLARILPITTLGEAGDAGLVIEAIVEKLAVKQALFQELESLLGPTAILASNTSSLSITALAAPLQRPGQVAGMHFFNPAPRMALVEIVRGLVTLPGVAACLHATATAWGKVAVYARSTPGFIVNRVARPFYGEALRVLAEEAASPATLDALLREGGGFPMGPFELMDLIGHDVNFAVTRSVFDAYFGDRRFLPSLIQGELVDAGHLGRKTGQGFYAYGEGVARPQPETLAPRPAPSTPSTPSALTVAGDLGPARALIPRLRQAGIAVAEAPGPGVIRLAGATLALSDGRPATVRGAEEEIENLVCFDLALDYATTPRLGVARAATCSDDAFDACVGALQAAGIAVSPLADVAALINLRTVCMLANEGADAVAQGVASAKDVDAAMGHGTNYPKGPLAWAAELGYARVVAVLDQLARLEDSQRYRVSPWLRRQAAVGRLPEPSPT